MPAGSVSKRLETRHAAWLRLLLIGLFLTELVVAQLWPTLHHAFFAHAVCPEHGDVMHVSQASVSRAAQPADAEHGVRADADADSEHDHCDVPPGTREPATAPAPALALADLPGTRLVPRAELVSPAFPPIPLLALAPKTSPPTL